MNRRRLAALTLLASAATLTTGGERWDRVKSWTAENWKPVAGCVVAGAVTHWAARSEGYGHSCTKGGKQSNNSAEHCPDDGGDENRLTSYERRKTDEQKREAKAIGAAVAVGCSYFVTR